MVGGNVFGLFSRQRAPLPTVIREKVQPQSALPFVKGIVQMERAPELHPYKMAILKKGTSIPHNRTLTIKYSDIYGRITLRRKESWMGELGFGWIEREREQDVDPITFEDQWRDLRRLG